MSYQPNYNRIAVPAIPNASYLYNTLVGMAERQVIDVNRSDLPPSYSTIKTILNHISRKHKMYFETFKLTKPDGWRIIKLNNILDIDKINIFKSKLKNMENTDLTRNYKMSDNALAQRVDVVILCATADIAQLGPRGVTAARLASLDTLNQQFKDFDDDLVMQAKQGQRIELRNAAYLLITDLTGNLRTMAQNTLGTDSYDYTSLGFEGMISANDKDLYHIANRAIKQAQTFTAQLLPEGFTPAFITQYEAALQDFDDKRDSVDTAGFIRQKTTEERIALGNQVYAELEKICNTGKDVFRLTSHAKYEQYVIYDTPTGSAPNTPTTAPFTVGSNGSQVLLNQPYNGSFKVEIKNTSMASCKVFLSNNGVTPNGITLQLLPNTTAIIQYSDLSASGDYLVLANENGMISATGEIKYPV